MIEESTGNILDIKMPSVFISYSHSNDYQCKYMVTSISDKLRYYGFNVIEDSSSLHYGENLQAFMNSGILDSDYVLVLCSPDYKIKAESANNTGVRRETELIISDKNTVGYNKYIPVLIEGGKNESIPGWAADVFYCDISTQHERYDDPLESLIEDIRNDFAKRTFPKQEIEIQDILGTWCDIESKRCHMKIEQIDGDTLSLSINWSSSAVENTEWHMSGKWNKNCLGIEYDNGVRIHTLLKEYSPDIKQEYIHQHGAMKMSNNRLYWLTDDESSHLRVFEHESGNIDY